ncbi:hypothetical protein HPB50_028562 [Hyalomma asiaticum]|nr:hypothetical protein HPB50_028562 [Hyalomma asiaticum]
MRILLSPKRAPGRQARTDHEVATLEELVKYTEQPLQRVVEPVLDAIKRGQHLEPSGIFRQSMAGCCKEHRFIHGSDEDNVYRFYNWQTTFAYYPHCMATTPPLGWNSVTHWHGDKFRGIFNLGDEYIRGCGLSRQVAYHLVSGGTIGSFDEWMISIGCKMDPSCTPFVKDLQSSITAGMHKATPASLVICYDGVDVGRKAKPRSKLNGNDACFFHRFSGVLLNFRCNNPTRRSSVRLEDNRKAEAYAGLAFLRRNISYPGGYDMCKVPEDFVKFTSTFRV